MKHAMALDDMQASTRRTKRSKNDKHATAAAAPLPEEMLVEIFARLPAKSAGRCRCLSGSWAATLSSASFVDFHLQRANQAGRPKMFLFPDETSDDGHLYSWQAPDGNQLNKLTCVDAIQQDRILPLTKPCRGLVLLRCQFTLCHYVCNPSTGALLAIPDSRIAQRGNYVSYGLGYSSVTKEYKIIRLLGFTGDGGAIATRCEVFVLDASSHWRPSAGRPPACDVAYHTGAVFLNGRLHFVGYGGAIVTFDVTNEVFGTLMHPADLPHTALPCLTELGGYLHVSHGWHECGQPYTMWVLRDYDAARWEKLCSIDQTAWPDAENGTGVTPVHACYDPGSGHQKIMFKTGTRKVFAVDLDLDAGACPDTLFSPDNIAAMGGGNGIGYVCNGLGMYEESLVSVGRTNEEIMFSSPVSTAWSEVFKRLPAARSVERLNAVCRVWHGIIRSKRFVHLLAVHTQLNTRPRIMFADFTFFKFRDLESIINKTDVKPPLIPRGSKFICSNPCHGLTIWGHATKGYFLCNPTTGYRKLLIELDDDDLLATLDENMDTFFEGRVALGYNRETNTHILACLFYTHRNPATRDYRLECIVRDVQGNTWYSTEDPPPRPAANAPPVYMNGKLFWMVDPELGPRSPGCYEILALDNATLRFEVLQGPPCSRDGGRAVPASILELGDSQLCVACASCRSTNSLELWVMKNKGRCSWSLEYCIDLGKFSPEYSPDTARPVTVDPNDGRILLSTGRSLGYYDPKTATLETVYCLGTGDEHDMKFVPVVHHESLFRPDERRYLRA